MSESPAQTQLRAAALFNLTFALALVAGCAPPQATAQEPSRPSGASTPDGSAAAAAKAWLEASKIPLQPEEFGRAVDACDVEKVKLFLAAGMDPNVRVSSIGTAVGLAITKAQVNNVNCQTVFSLVVQGGGKVGGDELLAAASSGNRSYVEVVLGRKVDVNYATEDGTTAAMLAAGTTSLGVMETLRDAGADLNKQDSKGLTALMHAVEAGDADMVRFLMATPGLDLAVKDRFGRTALALARFQDSARTGQPSRWHDVLQLLLDAKAPE